jgi:hypothetical protein
MPRLGFLWRHVIVNTKSTWLHGDPRGFRSRKHRIHSSGDYKNPPPPGEHAGLRAYHLKRSRSEIHVGEKERVKIGKAFIRELKHAGYAVIAIAVGKVHLHALVELPYELPEVKKIIGQAKRAASCAVSTSMPGEIWSGGGKFKPVMDKAHCGNVHDYIIFDQGKDYWTWSFRDASAQGQFGRCRPKRRSKKDPGRR